MKRIVFLCVFILLSSTSNAQLKNLHFIYTDHFQTKRFETNAIFQPVANQEEVWRTNSLKAIFTNQLKSDTLVLVQNEEHNWHFDSIRCEYLTKNETNKRNLVMLTYNLLEHDNLGEHGGFVLRKSMFEIWDLEKKARLFMASPSYHIQSDYMHFPETDDGPFEQEFTNCKYQYSIVFTSDSILIISTLETEWIENCEELKPDHNEGKYKLSGDEFVKID